MSDRARRIGFMQGRLSPQIDGKIQAFPWPYWRDEFPLARDLGFARLEWTLDHDDLAANPLMTAEGQAEIIALSTAHGVSVSSITGDCFMQAPFWKAAGAARTALVEEMARVIRAGAAVGASIVVVPLVDNGSVATPAEEAALAEGLAQLTPLLRELGVRIAFECDYPPARLAQFIAGFPADAFGINFDIGNSASLGWAPAEEIPLLAPRLINVHVKDRVLGGTTVALGEGDADLPAVFRLLDEVGYDGFLILQTARAADGDHLGAARTYRDLVLSLAVGS
ncbi:hexulose-6-phosphate isomerase [Caulobacter rhizosphaerae]|uniref:Hexulose-6-phosphate isomerase n=1 Tax=Caulobacter rhizosphaerae TaxID=2010972 RepID=A0ABU1N4E7_9CAUL|nr:sugar phosphate isomerase/epimerase family protein [Caulobacter rhizosphaerae]MDR6533331.1 hexulose-6-phosphate isomerase [Caulobacter rhizosphaerae]